MLDKAFFFFFGHARARDRNVSMSHAHFVISMTDVPQHREIYDAVVIGA